MQKRLKLGQKPKYVFCGPNYYLQNGFEILKIRQLVRELWQILCVADFSSLTVFQKLRQNG